MVSNEKNRCVVRTYSTWKENVYENVAERPPVADVPP
jgi:hypothetical protein